MTGMIPQEISMHPSMLALILVCIKESTLTSVFVQIEFSGLYFMESTSVQVMVQTWQIECHMLRSLVMCKFYLT